MQRGESLPASLPQRFDVSQSELNGVRAAALVSSLVGIGALIWAAILKTSSSNERLVCVGLSVLAFASALYFVHKGRKQRHYCLELSEAQVRTGEGARHPWSDVARIRLNRFSDRLDLLSARNEVLAFLDYRLEEFTHAFERVVARSGLPASTQRAEFDYRMRLTLQVLVLIAAHVLGALWIVQLHPPHPPRALAVLLVPVLAVICLVAFAFARRLRRIQLESNELVTFVGSRRYARPYEGIARVFIAASRLELAVALVSTTGETIIVPVPQRDVLELYSALKLRCEAPSPQRATSRSSRSLAS